MLEEADGRFIKKQRGIISDNTMMLERASTKLTYDCAPHFVLGVD